MRRFVLVAVPFALSLLAGPVAAALPAAPAKYATGQRCEDAIGDGRSVIRGLPASRAAWNGDESEALRALNALLDEARQVKLACEAAVSDADGHDDFAEHARLRAAWSTYMTEVDGALNLITRRQ